MTLEGKSIVITGAGSGIGRELARDAGRRGMSMILTGRRRDRLEETANLLPSDADVVVEPADITQAEDRLHLRQVTGKRFGSLKFLINNAGVQSVGPLPDMNDVEIENMIRTNLEAPITLTRCMLDLLTASAPSRIVNIGSLFGDIGFPLFAAYSASKSGLRGFSDALRRELYDDGIGVTYAAPRATRTPVSALSSHLVTPMKMTLDDPATVARDIMSAMERGARSVYPQGIERLFVLLQRLAPQLIDRSVVSQLRQVRHPASDRNLQPTEHPG